MTQREEELIHQLSKKTQLVEKLDEYIAWLNEKNWGPISLAHVHGWRVEEEDRIEGQRRRDEIEALRK